MVTFVRSTRKSLGIAGLLGAITFASGAIAAPVTVDIVGGGYTVGSGYGCADDESLLCVLFSYALANPASFVLNDAGDSTTLGFGSVQLNEADGPGSSTQIDSGETDNLEVTAFLNFLDPISGQVQSVATVAVVPGSLPDAAVDYSLAFAPVNQAFGSGGLFAVDFGDLSFSQNGVALPHSVQITLVNAPTSSNGQPGDATVPEPHSLALVGLGLLGMFWRGGLAFRRRDARPGRT